MADGIILERAGVPTAVVGTDAFRGATEAMAQFQGAPGYRYVAVTHPVESLTEVQLMELSARFIEEVIELLLARPVAE